MDQFRPGISQYPGRGILRHGGHDSRGRIKKPKLIELYTKLFNEGFEGAHDSMADIEATKKCYFECVKLGLIDQYE